MRLFRNDSVRCPINCPTISWYVCWRVNTRKQAKIFSKEVSALAVRCYSGCHRVLSSVTCIMIIVKSFVSFSFL